MFYTEDEGTNNIQNVEKYLPVVTALIFQKTWNLQSEETQEDKQKISLPMFTMTPQRLRNLQEQ